MRNKCIIFYQTGLDWFPLMVAKTREKNSEFFPFLKFCKNVESTEKIIYCTVSCTLNTAQSLNNENIVYYPLDGQAYKGNSKCRPPLFELGH